MQIREFNIPKIIYGEKPIDWFINKNTERLILFTNSEIASNNKEFDSVYNLLKTLPKEKCKSFDISTEPVIEKVFELKEEILNFAPDTVVALGGGAVIDSAKIGFLFAENPKIELSDIAVPFQYNKKGLINFIAIPTTSGTGSEATCAAIMTSRKQKLKQVFLHEAFIPSIALLDPKLTVDLPPKITAQSGFDALVHGIESFTASNATEWTKTFSIEAVKGVLKYLIPAYENPDNLYYRKMMQHSATCAGIAISNSCAGLSHSLDHFGVVAGASHGEALSALFLTVLQFNINTKPEIYFDLARAIDLTDFSNTNGIEKFTDTIKNLIMVLNLPLTLSDLPISEEVIEEHIEVILNSAENAFATTQNPRVPSRQELEKLVWYAHKGKHVDF